MAQQRLVPRPRIQLPELGDQLVARESLIDQVDAAAERASIALLCGPPGYGKTTLLAQWAWRRRLRGEAAAWVTFNRRDSVPSTFFADVRDALALALQQADPDVTDRLMELAVPTADWVEASVAEMLMVLDECDVPIAVVLDDLHSLEGPDAAEALESIVLGLLSVGCRVTLGSRVEPEPLTTRLRLVDRVLVLGVENLALSPDQIAGMLDRALGHADPELTTLVERQTEGWPAAVRFAVLAASTGRVPDPAGPALAHDPSLVTYLTREIVDMLPAPAVEVLRETAVVEELTPGLARALTGYADAGRILEELSRSQYLVRRIAGQEPWYVVHSLLRTHLLADLAAGDEAGPRRQHTAAARWFSEHRVPRAGLRHARASGDAGLIAELIASSGAELIVSGDAPLVTAALEEVGPDRWDEHLAGLAVLARVESGDIDTARRLLSRHAPSLAPPQEPWGPVPSTLRVAQFCVRRLGGRADDPGLPELYRDVLTWEPSSSPAERDVDREMLLLVNRGQWEYATGRYEQSWQDLRGALELASTHRRDQIALRCMGTLAAVHAISGESAEEARYVEEVLALVEARGWATVPAVANIYSAGAWAAHNMLLPARAELMIGRARAALRGNVDPEYASATALVEALLHVDQRGDASHALAVLDRFARSGPSAEMTPRLRGFAGMQRFRILLRRADFAGAERAATALSAALPEAADPLLCHALLDGAQHRWTRVFERVDEIERAGLAMDVRSNDITLPLLAAVAAQHLGRHVAARESLLHGLEVAQARGVLRPFYELGPELTQMLVDQRGRFGRYEDLVVTILTRIAELDALQARGAAPESADGPALTRRELDVLRELPSLMTVEEIAAAQVISVNTVRTHLRNLYRKLDVRTRRDAVRRGRQLGLLT